ncbi:MAG: serine hydrolase domain-containing protein [Candidatus Baltobacteraceae bacterium]
MKAPAICTLALFLLTAISPTQRAQIDAVFKDYNRATPGCAMAVFRNGTIAYARGYGMADLEHNVPITPASLFDVGSVSKQFAAAAIALLAERGKLSFHDDVHRYIPELPPYGAPLTIDELTWHTSGLRDYTDLLDLQGYGLEQATTDEQALASIIRQRSLDFPSGTQYEYSNTNYFLLSVIVKRVTGQTLAQFARQHLFSPLGMSHTVYRDDYAMIVRNLALGYAPGAGGHFRNSMSNWQQTGDGGVQLSVDDALRWDDNFYNPRVGGPELIAQLQTPGHLSSGRRLSYGRGLFIGTYRGLKRISHGGAWIGYRAEFQRYPALHTSIVVLCNSDAASPAGLARSVADIVLARSLRRVTRRVFPSKMIFSPHAVTGSYFNALGAGVLKVVAYEGGIGLDSGGTIFPLEPAGATSFSLGTDVVRFVFPKRAASATALVLNGGDGSRDVAQKFAPVVPTAQQLQGAAGAYHSAELDVTWRLRIAGHTVALEPERNLPHDAAGPLTAEMADVFTSAHGFSIRLLRNRAGEITGFDLGAGRGLRSLLFTRVR